MSLRDYLLALRRYWLVICSVLVVCVIFGAVQVVTTQREYLATAQIFVTTTSRPTNTTDLNAGNDFIESRVQSYTTLANSSRVTNGVISALKLPISSTTLAGRITADAPLNKVIINLHVQDGNKAQSARLANAVAGQFIKVIEDLERDGSTGRSPVRLAVAQPALPPTAPVSPKTKLILTLAVVVGLIAGLGLALILETLNRPASALPVAGTDVQEQDGSP